MRPLLVTPQDTMPPPATQPPRTDVPEIGGKFLSVTSFRRNGTGVATPVWFVTEGGSFLVMTDAHSGKVKRIRQDPVVRIAACSARGRPRAEPVPAYAAIMPPTETERVKRLIARKYRVDLLLVRPIRAIQALFRPENRREETVIVAITPTPAP